MKLAVVVVACGAAAGAAQAEIVRQWAEATAQPIGGSFTQTITSGTVFENLAPNTSNGQYSAFAAASGSLGFDDYDTSSTGEDVLLGQFQFVGGVAAVGGVISFDFFDEAGTFIDGFSVSFSQAGNFIWTITVNDPFLIPDVGLVELTAADGSVAGQPATLGRWFLSNAEPTIGSQDPLIGGGTSTTHGALSHKFAMTAVPTPGAAALLGLGGVAALRRRR